MDIEDIAKRIIDNAVKVHTALGPGLLESTYQKCMEYELKNENIRTYHKIKIFIYGVCSRHCPENVCHSGLDPESSDFSAHRRIRRGEKQRHWIPAFAGMTTMAILILLCEPWLMSIPVRAGIHVASRFKWTPVFTGVTVFSRVSNFGTGCRVDCALCDFAVSFFCGDGVHG